MTYQYKSYEVYPSYGPYIQYLQVPARPKNDSNLRPLQLLRHPNRFVSSLAQLRIEIRVRRVHRLVTRRGGSSLS